MERRPLRMPRGETGIGQGSQSRVGREVGAQPRWQGPDITGGDVRGRRGSAATKASTQTIKEALDLRVRGQGPQGKRSRGPCTNAQRPARVCPRPCRMST